MKIKSVTDVITNSSSEVFTLRTDKSPEEVYSWLKENIKWAWDHKGDDYPFTKPEIMNKYDGDLAWLLDYEYIHDSGDVDSIHDYKVKEYLHFADNGWYSEDYDYKIRKHGLILQHKFEQFCEERMDELLKCFEKWDTINTAEDFWEYYNEKMSYPQTYIFPANEYMQDVIEPFIEEFIKWYEENFPKYIPEWSKIPEYLDAQYWKGKIGFSTTDENSIECEDMEKICEEFDGEHWHMG